MFRRANTAAELETPYLSGAGLSGLFGAHNLMLPPAVARGVVIADPPESTAEI